MKQSPEELEKLIKAELKFRAYVACGWGLLVLFAMMGVMLGRPAGAVMAMIVAVMWVLLRITREAFDALRMLRGMKAEDAAGKDGPSTKKEDDGPPPGPPSAA